MISMLITPHLANHFYQGYVNFQLADAVSVDSLLEQRY